MAAVCQHILECNEEAYAVAMSSPAEVLLTGENTNSDFESPALSRVSYGAGARFGQASLGA